MRGYAQGSASAFGVFVRLEGAEDDSDAAAEAVDERSHLEEKTFFFHLKTLRSVHTTWKL